MNKHELKSLLENIYHLLAENAPPPPPPPQWTPESPGLYIPGYRGFVPFHLPTPPVAPPTPLTPPKLVYPPLTPLETLRGQVIDDYIEWREFIGRWIQLRRSL